jgi:hypothetical protein
VKVWIQRGHCWRTSGSTGTSGSGTTEQAHNNDIANRAAVLLRERGHIVKVALADERITGDWRAFVALHCDGSTSRTASGASVGYRDDTDEHIATIWKRRYRARGWPFGFRGDNYTEALRFYYGTGWAGAAGVPYAFVLEHGFLTNPTEDGDFLTSPLGRTVAAYALADTIEVLAGDTPSNEPTDLMEATMFCKRGDEGEVVKFWQTVLRDVDEYGGAIDGVYGAATAAAVLRARRRTGSDADSGDRLAGHAMRQLLMLWTVWASERGAEFKQLQTRSDRQNERIQAVERMHLPESTTERTEHVPAIPPMEEPTP